MKKPATMDDVLAELRSINELMAMNITEMLSREQAATMLGVSPATLDRMRSAGDLPHPVNLRGTLRYRRADLKAFLDQLEPSK